MWAALANDVNFEIESIEIYYDVVDLELFGPFWRLVSWFLLTDTHQRY